MKIDTALVDKIAGLARLSFTDEEKETMTSQFADIIRFVEQLTDVDTSEIDVLDVHGQKKAVLADDSRHESLEHKTALANAPFSDGEFFLVPKVIDGGDE